MGLGNCRVNSSADASDLLLLFCDKTRPEEKGDKEMNISWEMILPLIGLQVVLAVFALISCIKEERTNGPKWMWAAVIVCINIIGPILFFTVGRKQR